MQKILFLLMGLIAFSSQAYADNRPLVVELFTSQGCSSCPPADAVLQTMSKDPGIIPLSLHVAYWDYLGWKDPLATGENTARQHMYVDVLKTQVLFTPQMIIDGRFSVVGSQRGQVTQALEKANDGKLFVPIHVDNGNTILKIHVDAAADTGMPSSAALYALHYRQNSSTQVTAGENNGQTLVGTNSVTSIEKLGDWKQQAADYQAKPPAAGEGIAFILQDPAEGQVIGAFNYKQ